MARCLNCIHCDVCDTDRHEKERLYGDCSDFLNDADVVPKSEVERLTVELDAMRGAENTYKMHYENVRKEIERLKDYNTGVAFKHYFDGRKEVAREIFEEIEALRLKHTYGEIDEADLNIGLYELKKKYTEGKV